ncbi:hypothetical protein NMYAN_150001 [Nitrosomonas nitrosa]|uniref:Uncharacterized protein n=1 Tax=Nitrosomonas nitrosa TaxID=52442 RepID=A0A8H9DAT2_9PROT|nr:hypothetical protein NMYAN_150001 [Nitrosomonas nitrosa]
MVKVKWLSMTGTYKGAPEVKKNALAPVFHSSFRSTTKW